MCIFIIIVCLYRWILQLFNMKTKSYCNSWRHRSLKCTHWRWSSKSWKMSNVLMTRLLFLWIKCGIRFFPLQLRYFFMHLFQSNMFSSSMHIAADWWFGPACGTGWWGFGQSASAWPWRVIRRLHQIHFLWDPFCFCSDVISLIVCSSFLRIFWVMSFWGDISPEALEVQQFHK